MKVKAGICGVVVVGLLVASCGKMKPNEKQIRNIYASPDWSSGNMDLLHNEYCHTLGAVGDFLDVENIESVEIKNKHMDMRGVYSTEIIDYENGLPRMIQTNSFDSTIEEYNYDEDGKIVSVVTKDPTYEQEIGSTKFTYKDKFIRTYENSFDPENIITESIEFIENGYIVTKYAAATKYTTTQQFTYKNNLLQSMIETFSFMDGMFKYNSLYNNKGIIQKKDFYVDDELRSDMEVISYEGDLIKEVMSTSYQEDSNFVEKIIFTEYDEHKNWIKKEVYLESGELKNEITRTIKYK